MNWLLLNGKPLVAVLATLAALALVAGAARLYDAGEKAGAATVSGAVQAGTLRTLERARIEKEKTDEEVRRTPYDGRVDGLR